MVNHHIKYERGSLNIDIQNFYDMLPYANELIHDGATESILSLAIRLMATITNWHAIEKCLDYFIQILIDVAPKDNCIPKNYYEAKKLGSNLGLKAQKTDCSEGGFMLYYKDDIQLTE